jgi:hypothetical protein
MKDKGKVTVFLCLIVSAMALLGTTAVKAVSLYCAEGKVAMASRTAVSDVKANYDSYIFENYHILLFDKTNYGDGEASIEERMMQLVTDNLGSDYEVNSVELTDFTMVYDNACEELKKQIKEQMGYMAAENVIDGIEDKLEGKEGSYSDELEDEINEVESMPDETASTVTGNPDSSESDSADSSTSRETTQDDSAADGDNSSQPDLKKASDPRKYTATSSNMGLLLSVLLPPDEDVSSEEKLPDDIFSSNVSLTSKLFKINTSFDDYSDLKKDMKKGNTWGNSLVEKGEALVYASNVFNCFTDKDVNSGTVLECEMEYIIAGKKSDYKNLEAVCRKIMAVRLPVNMAYIVTDTEKIAVVKTLSIPLAAKSAFLAEPVIRYLIMAGWSYVEAMAETRNLLAGNRIDFVKTKENWITDLYDISGSMEMEQDSADGLGYKEYLMLLMAMEGDDIYYRMLDVMDINARQENASFRMVNAAVGVGVDFDITYPGKDISVHQSSSYDR